MVTDEPGEDCIVSWSEIGPVEVIENNRFAAFASLGRSPYGSVHDEEEMLRIFTNIAVPSPLCGWIFRARFPVKEMDRQIDHAVRHFAARKLPVIWNTGPSTRPTDLERHLPRYGFKPLFDLAGMAVKPDALSEHVQAPPGLEFKPVTDSEILMQWAGTFTAGFNVAGNVEASIRRLLASLIADPDAPWHLFLGVLDGAPVATSAMYLDAGVAGIYFVATVPEARRRGIGSLATLAPLRIAAERGYQIAVLHASPMAVSMYNALGFREHCRMGLFAWQPGA